jgi:hypothetical protein
MAQAQPWDQKAVHDELDRVRADFHRLLSEATPASLARRTSGTKWTNEQLLFHMLFSYLIVRALLPMAAVFGRLPATRARQAARHPARHAAYPRLQDPGHADKTRTLDMQVVRP